MGTMPQTPPTSDRDKLLAEVRRYCEALNISPSTLGVRALGNSRFFDRFKRRTEREAEEAEKLRAFMAANPPRDDKTTGAAA